MTATWRGDAKWHGSKADYKRVAERFAKWKLAQAAKDAQRPVNKPW